MEQPKINPQTIIEELIVAKSALKAGILNATLSKTGKENVENDLKGVIALAEQMKADLENKLADKQQE